VIAIVLVCGVSTLRERFGAIERGVLRFGDRLVRGLRPRLRRGLLSRSRLLAASQTHTPLCVERGSVAERTVLSAGLNRSQSR
jgi:hypothetical protein